MSTRDQPTAPDAAAPISAEMFRFVIVRPPRQAASDSPRASINLRLGKSSLADSLRKIATTGAGLRHPLLRPGERPWLPLHAPALLDCPEGNAQAIALPEDDYRRLAARRHETHARRAQGVEPHDVMNVRPLSYAEAKAPSP